jgi:transposase-like protein
MTDADPLTPADDDLWTLAREAYLSGATGSFVCREFDLAPSTFWRRAAAEGWLRRDTPASAREPVDPDAPVEPTTVTRDKAWRRMVRAMDQGRAAEAHRWLSVHEALGEIVRREQAAARQACDYAPEAVAGRIAAHQARVAEMTVPYGGA